MKAQWPVSRKEWLAGRMIVKPDCYQVTALINRSATTSGKRGSESSSYAANEPLII